MMSRKIRLVSTTLVSALFALLLSTPARAQSTSTSARDSGEHTSDKSAWGEHGMVLFGDRDGLYASHMPMFHAPHDAQVILAIHFALAKDDKAVRTRLQRHPGLWTIVPQEFDLNRLAPTARYPMMDMSADIVRGHFERGGKILRKNLPIHIDRVIVYRKLDPAPRAATQSSYIVLDHEQNRQQHFLVHVIDARPDFDHIALLRSSTATILPASVKLASPPQERSSLMPALANASERTCQCKIEAFREIYQETDDLK